MSQLFSGKDILTLDKIINLRWVNSLKKGSLIALVFCTGILNAYNFMDGINGAGV